MSIIREEIDFCILHIANIVRAQPFKRLVPGILCSPKLAPQTPRMVGDVARIIMEAMLFKSVSEMECIRATADQVVYRVDEKNVLTYNSVKPGTCYEGAWFQVVCEENNSILGYFFDQHDLCIDLIRPPNDGFVKETYGIIMPADESTETFRDITSLGELNEPTASYEFDSPGFKLSIEGMPIIGKIAVVFDNCMIPIEHGLFCNREAVVKWMSDHYQQTLGELDDLYIEILFYHEMPIVSIEVNDGGKIYVTRRANGELRFQITRGIKPVYLRGISALAHAVLNDAFPVATMDYYPDDPRIEHPLLSDPGFDQFHDNDFVDTNDEADAPHIFYLEDVDWFEVYGTNSMDDGDDSA